MSTLRDIITALVIVPCQVLAPWWRIVRGVLVVPVAAVGRIFCSHDEMLRQLRGRRLFFVCSRCAYERPALWRQEDNHREPDGRLWVLRSR